jgi:hypothetical protein
VLSNLKRFDVAEELDEIKSMFPVVVVWLPATTVRWVPVLSWNCTFVFVAITFLVVSALWIWETFPAELTALST